MKTDYFRMARSMSFMSDFPRSHTGCVVVYKNKIIGTGFNCRKTHPIQKQYNKFRFDCESPHSLHSEIHALCHIMNDKDIDWSRTHIFVYREYKNGKLAMSRPCKSCMQLIKDLGIKNIHYTTSDGYAYEKLVDDIK